MRLTVNRTETAGGHASGLADNASRLAFIGSEGLGGGLQALYGLEMGIDADAGTTTSPAFRNSYVGLASRRWGTFVMGRLDSSAPAGSPVYSQAIGIVSLALSDAGATAIGNSMLNGRNRTSNALGYQSPALDGFDMRARLYFRGDTAPVTPGRSEDAARSLDVGVNYQAHALKAGIGYSQDHRDGGLADNEFRDKWQAGLRYEIGPVSPYLLYGQDRYRNTGASRARVAYQVVGAQWVAGAHTVVVNVMRRDVQASWGAVRRRQQIAYSYALSKRTALQAFFDNDSVNPDVPGARIRVVGGGVRHDF